MTPKPLAAFKDDHDAQRSSVAKEGNGKLLPSLSPAETKAFSVGACSQWESPKLYLAAAAWDHRGSGAGLAAAWSLGETRSRPSLSSPHVPSPFSSDTSFFFFFFICTLLWPPRDELGLNQVTCRFPFLCKCEVCYLFRIVSLLGVCSLCIFSGKVRCVFVVVICVNIYWGETTKPVFY